MKDRIFIDSNVLIYGAYGNPEKKKRAKEILVNVQFDRVISIQVLKEFANVCLKKKLYNSEKELIENIEQFKSNLIISDITCETIVEAIRIAVGYQLSFYDSLIIATALEQDCKTLYSEDLHHGQTFKRKLKIINPFV